MNIEIRNRPQEQGPLYFIKDGNGKTIACFDNLEAAGIVLRYLQGAAMPEADAALAADIMRGYDAASRRSRKPKPQEGENDAITE